MAEVSVVLNVGSGGPNMAGYAEAVSGRVHQEVVLQTQSATSDPVSVSAASPLPVQNTVALPTGSNVIGQVALSAAIPAGSNAIGSVTQGGSPWGIAGNVAAGTADSGNGVKVSGVYNSSAPTYAAGNRTDLQADINGNLCVNIKAGANAGGTSSNFSSAMPSSGTAAGASNGTNMVPLLVDGSGNLKVNIVAGGLAAQTDNTSFTAGSGATLPISGVYNDSMSNLTSGNAGMPRLTLARQLLVAQQANVNGGWSPYTLVGAATTNAALVKGSPGSLGIITAQNIAATPVYLKFYNKASTPTPGTDTPVWQTIVPGNTAGAGAVIPVPAGLSFTTGIGISMSGGIALLDATALGTANQQVVSLGYF